MLSNLTLAFLLVVLVDSNKTVESDPFMFFRDIYRCNQFAYAISSGQWSPKHRPYWRNHKITAYCVPRRVPEENTKFYD